MSVADEVFMEDAKVTPHEELCDSALEHYNEISITAMHSNSLVPRAIEYYKRWVPQGQRKAVHTPGTLTEALDEGWVLDPWLNPRGSPIPVDVKQDHPVYWVLVKGTPEQIAGLEPFAKLPEKEEDETPEPEVRPYGLSTLFIPHDSEEKPPDDYVVMHKDHIFAKGTVYTKPPEKSQ